MTWRSRLSRFWWRLRRFAADAWGAVVTLGAAALIGAGYFGDLRGSEVSLGELAAASALAAQVITKLFSRLRPPPLSFPRGAPSRLKDDARTLKADLELGAALLCATYVTVSLTGGLRSPIYPLVYALAAFIVTFHRTVVGLSLVAMTFGLEYLLYYAAAPYDRAARELAVSHAAFIGFFAFAYLLFLQSEVLGRRREHRASIQREIERLREEARDFRLISSSLSSDPKLRPRAADEERLAAGAVETIHETIRYNLELLKKSLELHTCVLLWLDDAGERLKIKELVTDSDAIAEVPLPADAGALGTVVKNRLLVNLKSPKRTHLPYYVAPPKEVEIGSFLGVPVLENGHLRGVLCADRFGERAFTPADESILQGASEQMLRSIQSERVFAAVERAKYEHERFFAALSRLNRALTAAEVCQTTFEAVREFCEFDFGAITLFDPATRRHTVLSSVGETPKGMADGLTFGDNAGIASMVVKNKHFLPAGGEVRERDPLVFSRKVHLAGMESLLVLPLLSGEEAIGSFAVAARRPRAFGKDKREMLGVIANHVAVKLMSARIYARMEEMATTDGLTGLSNHRTFQERIAEMLARAERLKSPQALLLTDIDHFKKVNDTHGHPTGDVVLRGVAQVMRECVRKVDVAARYGGEEFALVLEATDLKGARQLAERIRTEVQKRSFQSEAGVTFECTLSLGIAVYPDDGRDPKALIAAADQALYHAKHNGRNRAVAAADHKAKLKAVK